jgi:hypothetical protein
VGERQAMPNRGSASRIRDGLPNRGEVDDDWSSGDYLHVLHRCLEVGLCHCCPRGIGLARNDDKSTSRFVDADRGELMIDPRSAL